MKKILLLVILWSVIFRACIIIWQGADYWYDEAVVANISKQSPEALLDSVSSEPHPPGFYFLLKALPVDNPVLTRLILLGMSGVILAVGLIWLADKGKIFEETFFGTIVFLMSFGGLWSGMEVKQGIVVLPLWLWWFWIWLYSWDNGLKKIDFWLWSCLTVVIAGLDYRYWSAALILTGLQFSVRKAGYLFYNLVILSTTAFVLFVTIGFEQIVNNLGRFTWTANKVSSVFLGILNFFIGHYSLELVGDTLILIVAVWLGLSIRWLIVGWKAKKDLLWFWLSCSGLLLLAVYIMTRALIEVRYALPFYLVLSLVLGKAMSIAWIRKMWIRKFITLNLALFGLFGMLGVASYDPGWFRSDLARVLQEIGPGVGLITDHPNLNVVYLIRHKELIGVVPVSVRSMTGTVTAESVTRDVLKMESATENLTPQLVTRALKNTGLTKFVYSPDISQTSRSDPDKIVFTVLAYACKLSPVQSENGGTTLVWKDCWENTLPESDGR